MTLALILLNVAILALLGVREYRRSRPPTVPTVAPGPQTDPAPTPAEPQVTGFVRVMDYKTDLSAITRRFESLEQDVAARHAQITGMFGQIKRASKDEQRSELARLTEEALASRAASVEEPPPPAGQQRRVVGIIKRG